MSIDKALLIKTAGELGIEISDGKCGKFEEYANLLLKTNESMNLTAITDEKGVTLKHFADSVSVLACDIKQGAKVLDVGTGAGFPGVPLAIMRPDLSITLLDSTRKKLDFIRNSCEELGIPVTVLHQRAEEAGRAKGQRESYDYVVSRAVASLNTLCEFCLPLVKTGGALIAMKGAKAAEELAEAANAIAVLGGKTEEIKTFELADEGERSLVIIRKEKPTSPKYPRASGAIAKKPL